MPIGYNSSSNPASPSLPSLSVSGSSPSSPRQQQQQQPQGQAAKRISVQSARAARERESSRGSTASSNGLGIVSSSPSRRDRASSSLSASSQLSPKHRSVRDAAELLSSSPSSDKVQPSTSSLTARARAPSSSAASFTSTSGAIADEPAGQEQEQEQEQEEIALEDLRKALDGVSRDDLLIALGRTKQQIDRGRHERAAHLAQIEQLQRSLASTSEELHDARSGPTSTTTGSAALAPASASEGAREQAREQERWVEELTRESERLETELYGAHALVERLRKQAEEERRLRASAEARYGEQSAALDKERQYFADAEQAAQSQRRSLAAQLERARTQAAALLKENERATNQLAKLRALHPTGSGAADEQEEEGEEEGEENFVDADAQIAIAETVEPDGSSPQARRASAARGGAGSRKPSAAQGTAAGALSGELELLESHERLRDEHDSLQRSHASLQATLASLQAELRQVQAQNTELRDQNETFQDVLEERTFSGSLLKTSALLHSHRRRSHGGIDSAGQSIDGGDGTSTFTSETDDTSVSIEEEEEEELEEEEEEQDDVEDEPKTPKSTTMGRKKKASARASSARKSRAARQEQSSATASGTAASGVAATDLGSELENATSAPAGADESMISEPAQEAETDGNADVARQRRLERQRKKSGTLTTNVKGERARSCFCAVCHPDSLELAFLTHILPSPNIKY